MNIKPLLFLTLMLAVGVSVSGPITLYDDTTSLPNDDLQPNNETLMIKVSTPSGEVIKKLYKLQP